jgi:hypothetical protein
MRKNLICERRIEHQLKNIIFFGEVYQIFLLLCEKDAEFGNLSSTEKLEFLRIFEDY